MGGPTIPASEAGHGLGGRRGRRRGASALALGVLVSAVTVAVVTAGALGAFTASISNRDNTATSGTVIMQQLTASGAVICDSSTGGADSGTATCATDLYGGDLPLDGAAKVTDATIKNAGTTAAHSFTLSAGPCAVAPTLAVDATTGGDLCTHLRVTLSARGGARLWQGSPAELAAASPVNLLAALGLGTVEPGREVALTVALQLPLDGSNGLQGQTITQQFVWTFGA